MKISTIEIRETKEVIQNREQLSIQTKEENFLPMKNIKPTKSE
jgi:hypothetical protein